MFEGSEKIYIFKRNHAKCVATVDKSSLHYITDPSEDSSFPLVTITVEIENKILGLNCNKIENVDSH